MNMQRFIALALATLTAFLVGALWYSPLLFGDVWMNSLQLTMEDLNHGASVYVQQLFLALLHSLGLAMLLCKARANTAMKAISVTAWGLAAFVFTTGYGAVLWAQKPMITFLIDASCMSVSSLLMSLVIYKFGSPQPKGS